MLPALALYGLFTIVPLISGIWLALLRWDGIEDAEFIGLDNFERMLNDERLREALGHNVHLRGWDGHRQDRALAGLALLLNQSLRGRAFYRTALFLPVVMSFVVVGILWTWIYNDDFGLVNNLLRSVGLGGLDPGLAGRHREWPCGR